MSTPVEDNPVQLNKEQIDYILKYVTLRQRVICSGVSTLFQSCCRENLSNVHSLHFGHVSHHSRSCEDHLIDNQFLLNMDTFKMGSIFSEVTSRILMKSMSNLQVLSLCLEPKSMVRMSSVLKPICHKIECLSIIDLEILSFNDNTCFTPDVAANLKSLRHLTCSKIPKSSLSTIFSHGVIQVVRLATISPSSKGRVDSSEKNCYLNAPSSLTIFGDIDGWKRPTLSIEELMSLTSSSAAESLKEIHVSINKLGDIVMHDVPFLPNLNKITLRGYLTVRMGTSFIKFFQGCHNLEVLDTTRFTGLNEVSCQQWDQVFQSCPHLKTLVLFSTRLDDSFFHNLSFRCPKMEILNIHNGFNIENPYLTDRTLGHLMSMTCLKKLLLECGSDFHPLPLVDLMNNTPDLEVIGISSMNPIITDELMEIIDRKKVDVRLTHEQNVTQGRIYRCVSLRQINRTGFPEVYTLDNIDLQRANA